MKRSAIVLCIALLLLVLVGCGKQTTTPTKKETPKTDVPPGEIVQEIDYETIFHVQYCNSTIGDQDYQTTKIRRDLEDSEMDLVKAQDELEEAKTANEQDEVKILQKKVDEEKANIIASKSQLGQAQSDLADTISKCNTLEKKVDKTICREFLDDAQNDIANARSEVEDQQKDIQTATELNQAERLEREKRKLAKAQAILTRVQAIYDELAKKCGAA